MSTEKLAYRHGRRTSGRPHYIAKGIARQYVGVALEAFWAGYYGLSTRWGTGS